MNRSTELTKAELRVIREFCITLANPGVRSMVTLTAVDELSTGDGMAPVVALEIRSCIDHILISTSTKPMDCPNPAGIVDAAASLMVLWSVVEGPIMDLSTDDEPELNEEIIEKIGNLFDKKIKQAIA